MVLQRSPHTITVALFLNESNDITESVEEYINQNMVSLCCCEPYKARVVKLGYLFILCTRQWPWYRSMPVRDLGLLGEYDWFFTVIQNVKWFIADSDL